MENASGSFWDNSWNQCSCQFLQSIKLTYGGVSLSLSFDGRFFLVFAWYSLQKLATYARNSFQIYIITYYHQGKNQTDYFLTTFHQEKILVFVLLCTNNHWVPCPRACLSTQLYTFAYRYCVKLRVKVMKRYQNRIL